MKLIRVENKTIDDFTGDIIEVFWTIKGGGDFELGEGERIFIQIGDAWFIDKTIPPGMKVKGTIKIMGRLEQVT